MINVSKALFGGLLFFLFSGCGGAQQPQKIQVPSAQGIAVTIANAGKVAVIKFRDTSFNFGTIKEGTRISHTFYFTNAGKSPLILADVRAGCGCTLPMWSSNPVKPGQLDSIKISFNSAGRTGLQKKSITITANTQPEQITLEFGGEVN